MPTDAIRLALTTFTVTPIAGPAQVNRATAGSAMRLAPLVGALLGLVLAGVLFGLRWIGLPDLVSATVTVGLAALLTRGMHLDGLADTVDALGSYMGRERALEIMKSPEIGPFGVVALALTLTAQIGAFTVVTPAGVVIAFAAGRLAVLVGCQTKVPAARSEGLGALVAGTVGPWALLLNTGLIGLAAMVAVPGRPWLGPMAIAVATVATFLARAHMVRRFGGITGDVLGFLTELATTIVLIGLCAAGPPR